MKRDHDQAAVCGDDFTAADAVAALSRCDGDTERAIRSLLDGAVAAEKGAAPRGVKAELHFSGAAPPLPHLVKVEPADEGEVKVKMEPIDAGPEEVKVKIEATGEVEVKVQVPGEVKGEPIEADDPVKGQVGCRVKQEEEAGEVDVKEQEEDGESEDEVEIIDPPPRSKKLRLEDGDADFIDLTTSHPVPYLNAKPIRALPPPGAAPASEWRMVVAPPPAELDQYPPDSREWCFFKKSYAAGLSTCRGRKLLDAGEVVHFRFPSQSRFHGVSYRQAVALAEIVRFSTNRSGELIPVWAKCLAPLVSSSTVMIQGKIVFPMVELRLMQEVLLYVSFYIHHSSMYLLDPENVDHPGNPLRALFKLVRRFGGSEH